MIGDTNTKQLSLLFSKSSAINSYINVNYPVGAICSCSNGTINCTASFSSGVTSFAIPSIGDWTVTITNLSDNNTKSEIITVAANNIYNITLAFDLLLYYYGNECISNSGGWAVGYRWMDGWGSAPYPSLTKTDDSLYYYTDHNQNNNGCIYHNTYVDFTNWNTLTIIYKVTYCADSGTSSNPYLCLRILNSSNTQVYKANIEKNYSVYTWNINITNINVACRLYWSIFSKHDGYIYAVYLTK